MADPDLEALWTAAQQRVLDLLDGMDDAAASSTPVPATPDWSVRDLVAHVVGVGSDAVTGDADPDVSDAWTAGHVARRADRTLAEVVQEWRDLAPRVTALLREGPAGEVASLVVDLTTHEQDLRGALDAPGARTDPALDIGVTAFGGAFAATVADRGLEPVRLVGDHLEVLAPAGSHPLVEASASTFELHRVLSGRRSAAQVRALDWRGDAEPYLPVLSRFGDLRDTDLVE